MIDSTAYIVVVALSILCVRRGLTGQAILVPGLLRTPSAHYLVYYLTTWLEEFLLGLQEEYN